MVFPSLPLYQDPLTWNQQHQQEEDQLQPHPNGGVARPNSMAERARLAKVPQPEQALKCPRCESTNTKFCYFNNYSLSQPRHFCKACRRYWTRGGAMRNVPVGGGCRRNSKRSSKSSGSGGSSAKTISAAAADCQPGASSFSTTTSAGIATSLPFMATLQPMMDYINNVPNLGLGPSGIQSTNVDYQQAGSGTTNTNTTNMGFEQWRLNQIQPFPFLGGLDPQLPPMGIGNIYNFNGALSSLELATQLAPVKTEDHSRGFDLSRNYNSSANLRNDQLWPVGNNSSGGSSGGGWMTNLLGFNSSSTGSLL